MTVSADLFGEVGERWELGSPGQCQPFVEGFFAFFAFHREYISESFFEGVGPPQSEVCSGNSVQLCVRYSILQLALLLTGCWTLVVCEQLLWIALTVKRSHLCGLTIAMAATSSRRAFPGHLMAHSRPLNLAHKLSAR